MKKKHQTLAIPVVILKTKSGYNAFSPVVDGCIVTAKSLDSALKRITEALEFHLEGDLLIKYRRLNASKKLKDAFQQYDTDALYASVNISA